ncbi:MAG: hypothetical protein AABZ54_02505 [Bacteroidota bacterium]
MKSIAIWYKPKTNTGDFVDEVELHFNLWKLPTGSKGHVRFLDIGIKLKNTTNIDELKLYFPTKIRRDDFEDIVDKFIGKPDLVSAIFNENYKVISDAASKSFQINDSTNKLIFNIYKTTKEDIKREEKYSGTIFSILVPKQDETIYFRFRIKGTFINSLISTSSPTNAILESAFSEVEMIDFRVNEIRDLDQSLLEEIQKNKKLKIGKQHFFFICSNEEEVIGSHQPHISCRNLENYRWNDYVGLADIKDQIFLAYHWKDKEIENSNILIKTKYEKNNWRTITKYILLALLIGMSLELLGNWVYDLTKCK